MIKVGEHITLDIIGTTKEYDPSLFEKVIQDIAKAARLVIKKKSFNGKVYNLGGPEILSFKDILDLILVKIRKKRIYVPLSFPIAKLIALLFSFSPVKPTS